MVNETVYTFRIVAHYPNGRTVNYLNQNGTKTDAIRICTEILATTPYLSVVNAWIVSSVMTPIETWVTVGPHMPSADSPLYQCRVCNGPMSDASLRSALMDLQQKPCGEACRAKEQRQHFACCEKATPIECVCAYAFTCPDHGERHTGSHD